MIDFPNTPVDGQIFTVGDTSWQYSSSIGAWLTHPYDLTLYNDLQVINDLQVDGNGQVAGHLKAGEFFVSSEATPTFASSTNSFYASNGLLSVSDKLVFDSGTPGSGGFGSLSVVGRIRGALENYEVVSLDKGSENISTIVVSGSVGTVTTSATHDFIYGDTVVIAGAASPYDNMNRAFRITGTGSNTFTVETGGTPSTLSLGSPGGTARIRELTIGLHPQIISPDGGVVSPAGLGMRLDEYNYWFLNNQFRVGSASKYFRWNGSTLEIVGKVTADEGQIGGWLIGATTLTGGNVTLSSAGAITAGSGSNTAGMTGADSNFRFWAGYSTPSGAPFRITSAGVLVSSGAVIQGSISAADLTLTGDITITAGGVNILNNYLKAGTLRVGPNVNGTDDGIWITADNYWYDTGAFKVGGPTQNVTWTSPNLTVTGTINATAGNITGALTVASGTMKFGQDVSGTNDGLYITANDYWYSSGRFAVASPNGIWYAGSGNVQIGTGVTVSGPISGSTIDIGGADATSFHVDISGNLWAGAATYDLNTNPFAVANDGSLRARQGFVGGWAIATASLTSNTGNITLSNDGNITAGTSNNVVRISGSDATYRLWAGNSVAASAPFSVTQSGALTATLGSIAGWTISPTAIHNGATVGIGSGATPFWAGGATPNNGPKFQVTSNGSLRATNVDISGNINAVSGTFAGSLSAATGTFAGALSAATGTFAGSLTAATGSFSGSITANSGTIAGWTITSTTIHNNQTIGIGTGATPFWAGGATPSNPAFSVTSTGALRATNANISGNINAVSGTFAGSLSAATGTFAGALSAATGTFAGTLSAASGSFSGNVTASAGSIAGWTLSPSAIHNATGTTGMGSGATPFWAGGATPSNPPFSVTSAGSLRATNAVISGSITATSGTFTGTVNASAGNFTGNVTVGTDTNKITLAATASSLTTAIYSGTGAFADTNTAFWIDASGRFSLGNSLTWDGTALAITGQVSAASEWLTGTMLVGQSFSTHPGTSGWYISTPDAASLDLSTSLVMVAYIEPTSWSPASDQTILAKWGAAGQRSYRLDLNTANQLVFYSSTDGTATAFTMTSDTLGISSGGYWVAFTHDYAFGSKVEWMGVAPGMPNALPPHSAWRRVKTTSSAGALSVFNSTAPLEIGSNAVGTANRFIGKVYRALVGGSGALYSTPQGYSPSQTGTYVADWRAWEHLNTATWDDAYAKTWTKSNLTITNASIVIQGGTSSTTTKIFSGTGTYDNANTPIYMDASGRFSLGDSLYYSGSALTVDTATIGGFTVSAGTMYSGTGATRIGLQSTGGVAIYAGGNTPSTAPFSLANDGTLTFNGASNRDLIINPADGSGGASMQFTGSQGTIYNNDTGPNGKITIWCQGLLTMYSQLAGVSISGIETATQFFGNAVGSGFLADNTTVEMKVSGNSMVRATATGVGVGSNVGPGISKWKLNVVGGYTGYPTVRVYADRASSSEEIFTCVSDFTSTERDQFRIMGNGNAQNRNNSYGAWSDVRLKTEIETARSYLDDILAMRIVKFQWKIDESPKPERLLGLIAQEVQEISPGLVEEDKDGYLGVKYSVLVPMLVTAIQELTKRIEELEA